MLITLLSDFGLHDPSVAVAKGILMQYTNNPAIDISHEITPFYIPQAAYLLSAAYSSFSEGTCHLLLFDLFSEAMPRLILSAYKGHYFLSPDNGLLPMAIGDIPDQSWLCYELGGTHSFIDWLHAAGKIIKQLEADRSHTSLPVYKLKHARKLIANETSGEIHCEVLHIDRYENIVLNFTRQQYDALRPGLPFQLQFMQVEEINEISTSYNSVREGYKLCRFNTNGYLEICINRGRAASLFGFRLGSKHNDIKIILE